MTAVNIIGGILLIAASVAIILVLLFTDTDSAGINSTFGGSSNSFYSKNGARTSEAKKELFTKIAVGIFFAVTIIVAVVAKFAGTGA